MIDLNSKEDLLMGEVSGSTQIRQFRQWVLTQTSPRYRLFVNEKDENVIVIETDYCRGEVTFFPMDIIQLSVLNLMSDRHEFYLHFQMRTLEHAQKLFGEMLESVQELTVKPSVKVLLCCTSGLTTGFFAQKLNESVQLLSLNYEFFAVSYGNLYQAATQYDVILLAPQISHIWETAEKILPNKKVFKIPPKDFGTYDVRVIFARLESIFQPVLSRNSLVPRQLPLKQQIKPHANILSIALIPQDRHYLFAFRIYNEKNEVIYDEAVVKSRLSLEDIYGLCDMAFAIYPDIQITGVSMPGIIDDGRLTLIGQGFFEYDIAEALSRKYSRTFILGNDANCIAVGYYASQDKYSSLSLLFHPTVGMFAEVGSIYNGQLIEGYKHVAGEAQYLPMDPVGPDSDRSSLWSTPEGALTCVSKTMASIISILGPDVLLLYCRLIVQTDELIREIERYVPKQYIPEIIRVDDVKDYMLLGQMILCTEALETLPDSLKLNPKY